MRRLRILSLLVTGLCASSASAQYITGGGTANQVPQFTSATTIGDSPIRITSRGQVCFGDAQFCEENAARVQLIDFRSTDENGNPPTAMSMSTACPNESSCYTLVASTNGTNSTAINAINYANGTTGGVGVRGSSVAPNSTGWGTAGVYGDFQSRSGVGFGVVGISWSPEGTGGIFANQDNIEVFLASGTWTVLDAYAQSGENRNSVFLVNRDGDVFSNGSARLNGAGYSTALPVAGDSSTYEAGDVLAIDPSGSSRLVRSTQPYSTRVAGVYSTQPAVIANYGYPQFGRPGELPVAIAGVAPCKVTTENGPIKPGDLLVAAWTPGHAMRGTDRERMVGAVVGKALEPLSRGRGVIKVLVTMQ